MTQIALSDPERVNGRITQFASSDPDRVNDQIKFDGAFSSISLLFTVIFSYKLNILTL